MVENSEVIQELLTTLLAVSGRKTTPSHAVYVLESTIGDLKHRYDFLENIELKDISYVEEGDQVTVMKQVDQIPKDDLSSAIKDILHTLTENLGGDAGYFFIKEVSQKLDEDIIITMKDYGVDLGLMQLERTVGKLENLVLKQ